MFMNFIDPKGYKDIKLCPRATAGRKIICGNEFFHQEQDTIF